MFKRRRSLSDSRSEEFTEKIAAADPDEAFFPHTHSRTRARIHKHFVISKTSDFEVFMFHPFYGSHFLRFVILNFTLHIFYVS